ncbi:MAG: TIGR03118 family protein [Aliidongia sp.]
MSPRTPYIAAALTAATLMSALWSSDARAAEDPLLPFAYNQKGLVSDAAGVAGAVVTIDPNLVDPWGLAFQPGGAFWVNDQGTGVATLYNGDGTKVNKTFTIPNPTSNKTMAGPTGLVWNPTASFVVPGTQLTSVFVFATFEGTIAAWAPNLPVAPTVAVTAVDNSKAGAVYTGLALGENAQGSFLYAANVHSGHIDVFDATFKPANAELTGSFSDPEIPVGFVPFGVQAIDGNIAVTYARQNPQQNFVLPAAGAGFVNIFDTNGNLIERLARAACSMPRGASPAPRPASAPRADRSSSAISATATSWPSMRPALSFTLWSTVSASRSRSLASGRCISAAARSRTRTPCSSRPVSGRARMACSGR